ncbi:hypothetical protein [Streptomyces sp. NPDC006879]|uniref:hypothetical protein n=1 Tax=Streptomyces sp. NPDC006879 TaxID=3364767 RepID=UPI0036A187DB
MYRTPDRMGGAAGLAGARRAQPAIRRRGPLRALPFGQVRRDLARTVATAGAAVAGRGDGGRRRQSTARDTVPAAGRPLRSGPRPGA